MRAAADRPSAVTHSPLTQNLLLGIGCVNPNINDSGWAMDVLQKFGQNVRRRRMALGLSQEEFADQCQLDRTYVSGVERGKRNIGLRNIAAISKALGVTIAQLTRGV